MDLGKTGLAKFPIWGCGLDSLFSTRDLAEMVGLGALKKTDYEVNENPTPESTLLDFGGSFNLIQAY